MDMKKCLSVFHNMKILVSIYSLHRGGAERVVSRLSQEWAKDHEVVIALSDPDIVYPYGGRIVDMKCKAQHSLIKKGVMVLKRIFTLVSVIRKEKPDAIFTFMEGANIPAIVASRILGVSDRLIISVRNNLDALHPLYGPYMRRLYNIPRYVVAVSEGVRTNLIQVLNLDSERVIVIPNPLPMQEIVEKKKDMCVLAEVSRHTIVATGRLVPQKGFDTLIRAYAHARKDTRMDDTNLVIMGEGAERQSLEVLIQELGVDEHITLPGAVENPFACFAHVGVFVLSSRMEGMPNVLLEAMASGVPVVSTDCPYGPADIISHEENGLLVPVDNIEALGDAMIRVYTMDDESRRNMLSRALEVVQDRDIEHIARLWVHR